MIISSYIAAIASSIKNKKKRTKKRVNKNISPIDVCTKEQSLKWIEQNLCQCCGAKCGEYKGICDICVWL